MRYLGLALCSAVLLAAAPAAAHADSITIDPGQPVVEGGTSTVSVTVDSPQPGARLDVIEKPADQGPCRSTMSDDYNAAGGGGSWRDVGTTSPAPSGSYTYQYTWPIAGDYQICAWLWDGSGTYAAGGAPFSVHRPAATLAVSVRPPVDPWVYSWDPKAPLIEENIVLDARGQSEAQAYVNGWAEPRRTAPCPTDSTPPDDAVKMDFYKPVNGAFDQTGSSDQSVDAGVPTRVCLYLETQNSQIAAATVDLVPSARPIGSAPVIKSRVLFPILPPDVLHCATAFVASPMQMTRSFRWFRGRKLLPSRKATYKLTRADEGRKISCRVTARNSAGSTTLRSKPLEINK